MVCFSLNFTEVIYLNVINSLQERLKFGTPDRMKGLLHAYPLRKMQKLETVGALHSEIHITMMSGQFVLATIMVM